MEENVYRYLFPYEKVPAGSRILIYGAGVLGQEYLKQMLITEYCKVIGFADRNFADYPQMVVPVYSPNRIRELDFDYIVIALRDGFGIPAIRQVLAEQGIPDKKIVYIFERAEAVPIFAENEEAVSQQNRILAYQTEHLPVALYLAGGFGDLICQKHFLTEILRLAPSARIDIYAKKEAEYVKWLYSDIRRIQNVLLDLGSRYISVKENYAFAISVFGAKFLQVDFLDARKMKKHHVEALALQIEKLRQKTNDEAIGHTIPGAVAYRRRMYNGENCRTWFNYGEVFSISDELVNIPLMEQFENDARFLGLHNYITVNTGNGSSQSVETIAKTWPLEHFEETVRLFKKKYPSVTVVQIGATDAKKLKSANVHLMGREFPFIACILRSAIFHLDIEGGLVHLASQIGTRCIVLFGPTPLKYYAYPQNINIKRGDCHGCYGLYSSTDRCARHMKTPACMYAITPEIVMEEIETYMRTRNIKADL